MLVLSLMLLVHLHLTSGGFIQFRLTTADPNHLTLECYNSHTALPDSGAVIQFFKNASEGAEPRGNVSSGAIFNVTTENESFLRCTDSDGVQSDFVAIAAEPSVPIEQNLTVNVFNDESAILSCPIPLGNLYDHLDPYTFHWEVSQEHAIPIPLNPSLASQHYSDNNRSFTVFVNDTTRSNSYRCVLRLRRCDIPRSHSPFQHYCPEKMYFGPITHLKVFERSEVVSPPTRQEVDVGEVAHFVCVGTGGFISILWEYDGEGCSNGSCGDAVVTMEFEGKQQITSTLMIDTSMLALAGGEYSATIGCVLHQSFPPEYNLQGRNQTSRARLVITAATTTQTLPLVKPFSPGPRIVETFAYIGGSILLITIITMLLACAVVAACCVIARKKRTKDISFKLQANTAYGNTPPIYEQVHETKCKYPTAEFTHETLPSLCQLDDNCSTAEGFVEQLPGCDMESSGDYVISEWSCCQMSLHEDCRQYLSEGTDEVAGQEFEQVKIFECCPNRTNTDKGSQLGRKISAAYPEQTRDYECVHYDETTMQLIRGVIRPYERVRYTKAVENMMSRVPGEEGVAVAGYGPYECKNQCEGSCCSTDVSISDDYERVRYGEEAMEILRKIPDVIYSDCDHQTWGCVRVKLEGGSS